MRFQTELLSKKHIRSNFKCAHESLNNYLKLQATKETKKRLARVYVLANEENTVIGYYTLSSAELPRESVPENLQKQLPKNYSGYPAILIGRLAVTGSHTGKGLGGELMVDALERCVIHSDSIGTRAIIVDPIDQNASKFYERYMFKALPDSNRMLLHIDNNLRAHFGLPNLIE